MPSSESWPYRVHESKDEHCITQKDTQPSQTCPGGLIKTHLCAICCCFFAIGEYNLIQSNLIWSNQTWLRFSCARAEVVNLLRAWFKRNAREIHALILRLGRFSLWTLVTLVSLKIHFPRDFRGIPNLVTKPGKQANVLKRVPSGHYMDMVVRWWCGGWVIITVRNNAFWVLRF